jgi:beta-lactamase regulating signal transducer with metallopeptidase domain
MLSKVFLQILNMSFTGGIVIVFVFLARLFLKKAPKVFSYALWSVVLFRLVCPFSFESVLSLLPTKVNPISQDIAYMQTPQIDTGLTVIDNVLNPILPAAAPQASINPLQIWIFIGSLIWLLGIAILLTYSIITLDRLQKRLQEATLYRDNIFTSDKIDTAFVMGVFRPRIYLPAGLSNTEREYILLHEQTHIKRLDHIVKLISFLVLCIHWFNPFVWVAFFASGKDMEMTCDEAVIKQLGNDVKKDYSSSLLTLAIGRQIVGGTPLAFGEGDTKGRIKNVLNYKKPTFWIIGITLLAVLVTGIGLLINPKNDPIILPTKIADPLEQAIHKAILEYNKNDYTSADIACESHVVLAKELAENSEEIETATVYAMVLYEEYNFINGKFGDIEMGTGSHIPTAITFEIKESGEYVLREYWQPSDGLFYKPDIEKKFPKAVWQDALDTQKFICQQQQNIYAQLIERGYIDSELMITSIIKDILQMTDDPSDWRLQSKQRELIYYGDYMLTYAYTRFLDGNQTDETAKIMETACRAILNKSNEDIVFPSKTGQEWFDAYLASIKTYQAKEGLDFVKANMPKAYLLLMME